MIVVVEELISTFLCGDIFNADPNVFGDGPERIDLITGKRKVSDPAGGILLYPDAGIVVRHIDHAALSSKKIHPIIRIPSKCTARPTKRVAIGIIGVGPAV